jgi:excisionase family DNA binding protein
MRMTDKRYTPCEVAEMLGVKTSTVHAWLSRKEMRALKVGHRRYITLQNIKDFREQRKTGEHVDYTYANGPVR